MQHKGLLFRLRYWLIYAIACMLLSTTAYVQPVQYPVQSDAATLNRLYGFMIVYEDAMNFDLRRVQSLIYQNRANVEVFNDLPGETGYTTWAAYRNRLEELRRQDNIEYKHFNLRIDHVKKFPGYDVVHAFVTRSVGSDTHNLIMSFIYYKHQAGIAIENRFKILKIERYGDSFKPHTWQYPLLPASISLHGGVQQSQPVISESGNWPLKLDAGIGYNTGLGIHYRLWGGKNHALLFSSGLGVSNINSNWSLDADEMISYQYERLDRDNDRYQHVVGLSDISQNLSLMALDLPVGLSWMRFFPNGNSLTLGGGIMASYLLSQDHSVETGTVTHRGLYERDGYYFALDSLRSYGFSTYQASPVENLNDLRSFSMSMYGNMTYIHPVSQHLNIFISPYVQYGWSNLSKQLREQEFAPLAGDQDAGGQVRALAMFADNIKFFSYGVQVGLRLDIKNINKNYVPRTRFRRDQSRSQLLIPGIRYASKPGIIPGSIGIKHKDEQGNKYKVRIKPESNVCMLRSFVSRRPGKIAYQVYQDSLHIFKPFGYNIHPVNTAAGFEANKGHVSVALDPERSVKTYFNVTPLSEFNLFVVKLTAERIRPDDPFRVDLDLQEPARRLLESLSEALPESECGYFLYHTAGQADQVGSSSDCYPCGSFDINRILDRYFADEFKESPANWIESIQHMFPANTNPSRNKMNLFFVGSFDAPDINYILASLQDLDADYLGQVSFHLLDMFQLRYIDRIRSIDFEMMEPGTKHIELRNLMFYEFTIE